jgi:hypothetical protein
MERDPADRARRVQPDRGRRDDDELRPGAVLDHPDDVDDF